MFKSKAISHNKKFTHSHTQTTMSLEKFNVALMSSHVWKILTHKETLWVRWIYSYKLKNRSFWDIPIGANISWGWRKFKYPTFNSASHLLQDW